MINRMQDNSTLDQDALYSGGYLDDSDSRFNSGINVNFVNNSSSISQLPDTLIKMEPFNYPLYIPNMDYMQCVQSGDSSFGTFCSSKQKLSYSCTQGCLQPASYSSSSEQDIDLYLFNTERNTKSNKVDENDNSRYTKCRKVKGRDNGGSNIAKKRHVNPETETDSMNATSKGEYTLQGRGKHGKALARHPFIPSYMDPNSGPHLCVVCKHNASGFHYRVMACEGCKGFFRRTVQNNLTYSCKFNKKCDIQPHNRAQCQDCRWRKCLEVGMAKDLVLSDEARRAKKDLIAANRAKKQFNDKASSKGSNDLKDLTSPPAAETTNSEISAEEERFISQIQRAFDETDVTKTEVSMDFQEPSMAEVLQSVVDHHVTSLMIKQYDVVEETNINTAKFLFSDEFNVLTLIVEPILQRVVSFAVMIPHFQELSLSDQIVLLKNACFDIICLRNAINYDRSSEVLTLGKDFSVGKDNMYLCKLLEPTYMFVKRISSLSMDPVEVSLIAALGLLSCDRPGLQDVAAVERLQDKILRSIDFYMKQNNYEKCQRQSELYATVLPDLRSTTCWHLQVMSGLNDSILGNLPSIKALYHFQDSQARSPYTDSSNSRFSVTSFQLQPTSSPKTSIATKYQTYDTDLEYLSCPYTSQSLPSFYSGQGRSQSAMIENGYPDVILPSIHLGSQSSFTDLLIESSADPGTSGPRTSGQFATQGSSSSSSYANGTPVTSHSHRDPLDPVFDFTNNF